MSKHGDRVDVDEKDSEYVSTYANYSSVMKDYPNLITLEEFEEGPIHFQDDIYTERKFGKLENILLLFLLSCWVLSSEAGCYKIIETILVFVNPFKTLCIYNTPNVLELY